MASRECVLRLSWEGLAALCRRLAEQVAAEFTPDLVVGVARGGTLPGALIALLLRRDFHSLRVPGEGSAALAAYLPPEGVIAGRRVLLVDERAPDESILRGGVAALRRLGAREVRTLTVFAGGRGAADFTGPEVTVPVLQPWFGDVVPIPIDPVAAGAPPCGTALLPAGRPPRGSATARPDQWNEGEPARDA